MGSAKRHVFPRVLKAWSSLLFRGALVETSFSRQPTQMTHYKGSAMNSIRVEEAQAKLAELIAQLKPGEALEITKNHEIVAKIVRQKNARQFGLGKGKLKIVVEDDEHLSEFKEYMP
jgi:antitoxin (DNA-binding transcriptional repressor) of toxin-antitoxin stability system